MQEVPEHRAEIEALGAPHVRVLGRDQARHVDGEVRLERRVLEEVGEHLLLFGLFLELELDADVVGRDVLHVDEQRHLARERYFRDALDELSFVDRVGDARDVHGLRALALGDELPRAAHLDHALPGLVDLLDLLGARDDLPSGREIRPLDGAAELARRRVARP